MLSRFRFAVAASAFGLAVSALPAAAQSYDGCLAHLRSEAAAKGVSASAFDRAMRGMTPDMTVFDSMNAQPEFKTPVWDYLGALVDDERVSDGRAAMRQHARAVAAVEQRFGVDRYAFVGVWGVESNFGKNLGKKPILQSLSTLACFPNRRQGYFKGEFMATLQIVQRGDVRADRLMGSWAGAFGQTQFMPSTFLRLAVDQDGDGRRDLVDSVPDALGSTANFLKKGGWVEGLPWGYEVRLPRGFNAAQAGRKAKKPLSHWAALGVTHMDGRALSGGYQAGILLPAGANGPAFVVTKNFDVFYSYNASEAYGLAIGVLGDVLRGRPGIQTPWPTDDPPLSRADRRELQRLLTARGYDVGEPDGAIGSKTREAIKEIERAIGMPARGRPGGKVLNALRRG